MIEKIFPRDAGTLGADLGLPPISESPVQGPLIIDWTQRSIAAHRQNLAKLAGDHDVHSTKKGND